jgi:hypothetical protein
MLYKNKARFRFTYFAAECRVIGAGMAVSRTTKEKFRVFFVFNLDEIILTEGDDISVYSKYCDIVVKAKNLTIFDTETKKYIDSVNAKPEILKALQEEMEYDYEYIKTLDCQGSKPCYH